MRSVVVGVCGGSGSGKTTLVRTIAERCTVPVSIVLFDNYYCDQGHLTMPERHAVNYDHPDSLDVDLFIADLQALRAGNAVDIPVYDFSTHTRVAETQRVEPTALVLVDGILLLAYPELRECLDLAVYVEASDELRTERRLVRDVEERGRTVELSMAQIEKTVRPMFEQFVAPNARYADLVIDGTAPPDASADIVLDRIAHLD